jgi:hypothetical protein
VQEHDLSFCFLGYQLFRPSVSQPLTLRCIMTCQILSDNLVQVEASLLGERRRIPVTEARHEAAFPIAKAAPPQKPEIKPELAAGLLAKVLALDSCRRRANVVRHDGFQADRLAGLSLAEDRSERAPRFGELRAPRREV